MRYLLLILAMSFHFIGYTQNCQGYYFLQDNKSIEMEIYNKKGNLTGKQVVNVTNLQSDGEKTTAELDIVSFDKKGKKEGSAKSSVQCIGGAILIDMKMNFPAQQGGPKFSIQSDNSKVYMEYPSTMEVGDQLKDASINLEMSSDNGLQQTVNMDITKRSVIAKENIVSPAGTWECYKITQHYAMNIKTMGIGIPMNYEVTEWFSPGFGVIKTESKHGSTLIVGIK